MTAERIESYYWEVYALIFENGDIVDLDNPDFALSDPDTARIAQIIQAVIPLRDSSRLYVEVALADYGEVVEDRYAYIYLDARGRRILQYDNRSHHPEISTHPHHLHHGPIPGSGGKDRAWPTDIDFASFESVLQRIRERYFE